MGKEKQLTLKEKDCWRMCAVANCREDSFNWICCLLCFPAASLARSDSHGALKMEMASAKLGNCAPFGSLGLEDNEHTE